MDEKGAVIDEKPQSGVPDEKVKAEIHISGMSCAGCARTVEKSLLAVEGVKSASVNLGSASASVEFDPHRVTLADLQKAVLDAGYGFSEESMEITVGGMTCAGCAKTAERALKKIPGVIDATVNLNAQSARVRYVPGAVSSEELGKAIESAGYHYGGRVEETHARASEAGERELSARRFRAILGFVIGIPLMAAGMTKIAAHDEIAYLEFFIATPAFLYIGYPIFRGAWLALRHRNLTMDVMYAMGISVAFLSSVCATFKLGLSREFLFYDTAVLLSTFLMLGKYLEGRARGRTGEAIRKLIELRPQNAIVIRNGQEVNVPAGEVRMNESVVVKPGGRFPVDGIVISGESYVDESMISGEPMPVAKRKGDHVIGGTINKNGILTFTATRVGKETFLAQMIQLVRDAQASKPSIQKIADAAVTWFIPVILAIALVSSAVWYFVLGSTLHFAMTVLISVLVIACPCALGLATPAAVTVGVGRGAELGIFIKNSEVLELSGKLTAVILDKTGTITKGAPEVTDVTGDDTDTILTMAASIEKNSDHPLAEAIVSKAAGKGFLTVESRNFRNEAGKGVTGDVRDHSIVVGSASMLEMNSIPVPEDFRMKVRDLQDQGKTTVLVAVDGAVKGIIAITDAVKENAESAVAQLRNMNLDVVMVTGDNERSASRVAKSVGIEKVIAGVLPQEKEQVVRDLQARGEVVAFIGDGINDAPALARADVGIAMGGGTDVAIESGEVVLVRDDLMDAVAAIQLSRKVMSRIRQNLFWAFAYNALLIPVAAGLLHPAFGLTLKPEFAGFAMAMSSITVLLLSLTLKRFIPPAKKITTPSP